MDLQGIVKLIEVDLKKGKMSLEEILNLFLEKVNLSNKSILVLELNMKNSTKKDFPKIDQIVREICSTNSNSRTSLPKELILNERRV